MDFLMPRIIFFMEQEEEMQNSAMIKRGLRDKSNPFTLDDIAFRKIFRLNKEIARYVIESITSELGCKSTERAIPNVMKVLIALQFYGHGSYQKIVGQDFLFPVCQTTVSRCITHVSNAIVKCMGFKHVTFPINEDDKMKIKRKFNDKYDFPGIIGIIDGSHIPIIAPPTNHPTSPGLLFFNRKGFYSINTLFVCDSDLRILYANANYPGSVHDAAIWSTSDLRNHLQSFQDSSSWIIGDQGFPLEPWLMVPIANAVPGSSAAKYNKNFRNARMNVETCIGRLKNIFRCLHKHRVLHYKPTSAGKIINACAILHNIKLESGDNLEEISDFEEQEEGEDVEISENDEDPEQGQDNSRSSLSEEARRIRQRIINQRFL